MASSECAEQYCSLQRFSSRLHLWTLASLEHVGFLPHFIGHYWRQGVPTARMTIVLHSPFDGARESAALAVLNSNGVSGKVWRGDFDSNAKRDLVNKFIAKLPRDHWLVYADVDEMHRFPCLAQLKPVCGLMLDRLPADGAPVAAAASVANGSLTHHFPVCAHVRPTNSKWLVVPASTRWESAHTALVHGHAGKCTPDQPLRPGQARGITEHYMLTAEGVVLARVKRARYANATAPSLGGREHVNHIRKANYDLVARMVDADGRFVRPTRMKRVCCPRDAAAGTQPVR